MYGTQVGTVFGVVIVAMARWRLLDRLSIGWMSAIVGLTGFLLGASAEPGYVAATLFALFGAACAVRIVPHRTLSRAGNLTWGCSRRAIHGLRMLPFAFV
jgi:hypothetical protein